MKKKNDWYWEGQWQCSVVAVAGEGALGGARRGAMAVGGERAVAGGGAVAMAGARGVEGTGGGRGAGAVPDWQVYKGQERWQGPGPGVRAVVGAVELAASVVVCKMVVVTEVLIPVVTQ